MTEGSYEALYSRMQEIVAALERGDLPLAETLALYTEGVSIAESCQKLLDTAELQIRELQR